MGWKCRTCRHELRPEIDRALIRREPRTELARRYGLHVDGLERHARNHIPPELWEIYGKQQLWGDTQAEVEALESEEKRGLLRTIVYQRAVLLRQQRKAEELEFGHLVIMCAREIRKGEELIARYLGQFASTRAEVTHHHMLLQQPEYLDLRCGLIEMARAHPNIRADMDALLNKLEGAHLHLDGVPKRVLESYAVAGE